MAIFTYQPGGGMTVRQAEAITPSRYLLPSKPVGSSSTPKQRLRAGRIGRVNGVATRSVQRAMGRLFGVGH